MQRCTSVYRSNVLALYSFYPPEPKCITQSKTQRSQINFAAHLIDSSTNWLFRNCTEQAQYKVLVLEMIVYETNDRNLRYTDIISKQLEKER